MKRCTDSTGHFCIINYFRNESNLNYTVDIISGFLFSFFRDFCDVVCRKSLQEFCNEQGRTKKGQRGRRLIRFGLRALKLSGRWWPGWRCQGTNRTENINNKNVHEGLERVTLRRKSTRYSKTKARTKHALEFIILKNIWNYYFWNLFFRILITRKNFFFFLMFWWFFYETYHLNSCSWNIYYFVYNVL